MFNIPQKFDGVSVLPAAEFNSLVDELKNIITSSGQALTGADVTQIAKAMANYVMNGNFFTDSGVANAYLLGVVGAKLAPTNYTNGFTVLFKVGNTNTGASTVNVAGLGIKSIKKNNGADDIDAGDLPVGNIAELVYDLSGDYFELTRTEFIAGDFLRRNVTNNVTVGYTTTAYSLGNSGTGTVTPIIANGHIQTLSVNGNFTLAAPTDIESGFIVIEATNIAPGGFTINTAAFTIIDNNYDSSSGKVNFLRILKVGSTSYLSINPTPIAGSATSDGNVYNPVINGAMQVWQRGTSFAAIANGAYSADKWLYTKLLTTGVQTISRSTTVPAIDNNTPFFNYSMQVTNTTADVTVGAGDLVTVAQGIEGYKYTMLAQRDMTLSFWVRSSITGTYCIAVKNSGNDRSYIAEYTISAANTYERKTITIPASPSAGSWNYLNGVGLSVHFTLMAGATYQAAAGSWQTGNFLATSNQTNFLGTNGATFNLTAVKLENGSTATPYFIKSFDSDLWDCLRYFEKSYNYDLAPGHIGGTVMGQTSVVQGAVYLGNGILATAPQPNIASAPLASFLAKKRTTPTTQIYNPSNGNAGVGRNITTNLNSNNNIAGSESYFIVGFPTNATIADAYEVQYTADADFTSL